MVKDFKCRVPGCEATKHQARGICLKHYQALAQMVHRGQTTWDELEERGKIAPRQPRNTHSTVKAWALDEEGKPESDFKWDDSAPAILKPKKTGPNTWTIVEEYPSQAEPEPESEEEWLEDS